jgi:hypothetical protein
MEIYKKATVYLKRIGAASIEFVVKDGEKVLTSGRTFGFIFDDKNNIFTASRLRVHNVAELVFDF